MALKKEIFICDECGCRKRLSSAARHWCDNTSHGRPLEMRPARDKRIVIEIKSKQSTAY